MFFIAGPSLRMKVQVLMYENGRLNCLRMRSYSYPPQLSILRLKCIQYILKRKYKYESVI